MRYSVPGVPPQFSPTAFTPNLVRLASSGAQRYKQAVVGQPGTQGIPAPYPEGVSRDPSYTSLHQSPDAPPVWWPQLYYQTGLTNAAAAGGESVYSDNCMPVPAVDPRGRQAVLAKPPKLLGGKQVAAVPITPRWA
jgi:hypothetical protein